MLFETKCIHQPVTKLPKSLLRRKSLISFTQVTLFCEINIMELDYFDFNNDFRHHAKVLASLKAINACYAWTQTNKPVASALTSLLPGP